VAERWERTHASKFAPAKYQLTHFWRKHQMVPKPSGRLDVPLTIKGVEIKPTYGLNQISRGLSGYSPHWGSACIIIIIIQTSGSLGETLKASPLSESYIQKFKINHYLVPMWPICQGPLGTLPRLILPEIPYSSKPVGTPNQYKL
ncbi:hypothetical protein TSTA_045470, partial [Talaromyces stipitatus ATCC 10500]